MRQYITYYLRVFVPVAAALLAVASCHNMELENSVPSIKTLDGERPEDSAYSLCLTGECDCKNEGVEYYFLVSEGSLERFSDDSAKYVIPAAWDSEAKLYKSLLKDLKPGQTWTFVFCARNIYGSIVKGEYKSKTTDVLKINVITGGYWCNVDSEIISYTMRINGLELSKDVLVKNARIEVFSDAGLTKQLTSHYYYNEECRFNEDTVTIVDKMSSEELSSAQPLYYRAAFENPYQREEIYYGDVLTYQRLDVKMEYVGYTSSGIGLVGSCSFKPSKALFEMSMDEHFASSTYVDASSKYNEKSYYPNTYELSADVPYTSLKTGVWYIRCHADNLVSESLKWEYVTRSTSDLLKEIENINYQIQELQAHESYCQKQVMSLEDECNEMGGELKTLRSSGLFLESINQLDTTRKQILSSLNSLDNQLADVDTSISKVYENVQSAKKELSGISELPEQKYQEYEKYLYDIGYNRLYEIQSTLDLIQKNIYECSDELNSVGSDIDKLKKAVEYASKAYSGANCFIVDSYGTHAFKAQYKGGSKKALDGTPSSAEVLWESYGTSTTPKVGSIVSGVQYVDGIVIFDANSDGNAVVAVKDVSGKILWSWHLWVCKGFDPEATAQMYNNNAGTMMDRNLGATSAAPGDIQALGLLYQWGRKDPFLGTSSVNKATVAKSTLTWPVAVTSSSSTGTIAYTVANPTTFIIYNDNNYDWYYTGSKSTDDTRWQTSDKDKGIYDPCPVGWRVPDGGNSGIWSESLGGSSIKVSGPWDSTNRGMNLGSGNGKSSDMQLGPATTIWYPGAGNYHGGKGTFFEVGYSGFYWSCTSHGYFAYNLHISSGMDIIPSDTINRASGQSVRCIKEKSSSGGGGSNEGTSEMDWIK